MYKNECFSHEQLRTSKVQNGADLFSDFHFSELAGHVITIHTVESFSSMDRNTKNYVRLLRTVNNQRSIFFVIVGMRKNIAIEMENSENLFSCLDMENSSRLPPFSENGNEKGQSNLMGMFHHHNSSEAAFTTNSYTPERISDARNNPSLESVQMTHNPNVYSPSPKFSTPTPFTYSNSNSNLPWTGYPMRNLNSSATNDPFIGGFTSNPTLLGSNYPSLQEAPEVDVPLHSNEDTITKDFLLRIIATQAQQIQNLLKKFQVESNSSQQSLLNPYPMWNPSLNMQQLGKEQPHIEMSSTPNFSNTKRNPCATVVGTNHGNMLDESNLCGNEPCFHPQSYLSVDSFQENVDNEKSSEHFERKNARRKQIFPRKKNRRFEGNTKIRRNTGPIPHKRKNTIPKKCIEKMKLKARSNSITKPIMQKTISRTKVKRRQGKVQKDFMYKPPYRILKMELKRRFLPFRHRKVPKKFCDLVNWNLLKLKTIVDNTTKSKDILVIHEGNMKSMKKEIVQKKNKQNLIPQRKLTQEYIEEKRINEDTKNMTSKQTNVTQNRNIRNNWNAKQRRQSIRFRGHCLMTPMTRRKVACQHSLKRDVLVTAPTDQRENDFIATNEEKVYTKLNSMPPTFQYSNQPKESEDSEEINESQGSQEITRMQCKSDSQITQNNGNESKQSEESKEIKQLKDSQEITSTDCNSDFQITQNHGHELYDMVSTIQTPNRQEYNIQQSVTVSDPQIVNGTSVIVGNCGENTISTHTNKINDSQALDNQLTENPHTMTTQHLTEDSYPHENYVNVMSTIEECSYNQDATTYDTQYPHTAYKNLTESEVQHHLNPLEMNKLCERNNSVEHINGHDNPLLLKDASYDVSDTHEIPPNEEIATNFVSKDINLNSNLTPNRLEKADSKFQLQVSRSHLQAINTSIGNTTLKLPNGQTFKIVKYVAESANEENKSNNQGAAPCVSVKKKFKIAGKSKAIPKNENKEGAKWLSSHEKSDRQRKYQFRYMNHHDQMIDDTKVQAMKREMWLHKTISKTKNDNVSSSPIQVRILLFMIIYF